MAPTFIASLSALLLPVAALEALAAHPLETDDTGTQGARGKQVEVTSDRSRLAGEKGHAANLVYSYGILEQLDMYAGLPVSLSSPSGRGDLTFGMKWRFWQDHQTSLAVRPELSLPTGAASKGLGNGRASAGLTFIGSHAVDRWALHGNLGFSGDRYRVPPFTNARNVIAWRLSMAVAYTLNAQWLVVADTGIARNIENLGTQHPAFILVGAIYSPRNNLDVDIGFKKGLNAAEVDRQVGAGLTIRF